MPFQAYNKMLIPDQTVKNYVVEGVTVGYEFKIQYPSYRGTFLSCIEELNFKMDDVDIPRASVYFLVNGKQFLLDELSECFKEYWYILDYATIRVMLPGGLTPGKHKVGCYIKHRIPYTGYFGQYLVLDGNESKELDVE